MRSWILRQIALGDVLPVAAVIGKRDGVLVDDFDKPLRPATVLDIGLAVRGSRREIEAVGLGEEAGEIFVDIGAPAAARLDMGVSLARALAALDRLHRRGEGDVAGIGVSVRHLSLRHGAPKRSSLAKKMDVPITRTISRVDTTLLQDMQ
jgi:hypothetical protein